MQIPEINIADYGSLSIDKFREIDYLSIERYNILIELLMENAGLQLDQLADLH